MLLFLVRHAHADPGEPDELRALSDRGRAEADALGELLATHATPPQLVVSSPLLRACQTAEAIGRALAAETRIDERLAPGATVEELRGAVARVDGPVAVVAHQPDCSEIALALSGEDPGFSTGSVAELTLTS